MTARQVMGESPEVASDESSSATTAASGIEPALQPAGRVGGLPVGRSARGVAMPVSESRTTRAARAMPDGEALEPSPRSRAPVRDALREVHLGVLRVQRLARSTPRAPTRSGPESAAASSSASPRSASTCWALYGLPEEAAVECRLEAPVHVAEAQHRPGGGDGIRRGDAAGAGLREGADDQRADAEVEREEDRQPFGQQEAARHEGVLQPAPDGHRHAEDAVAHDDVDERQREDRKRHDDDGRHPDRQRRRTRHRRRTTTITIIGSRPAAAPAMMMPIRRRSSGVGAANARHTPVPSPSEQHPEEQRRGRRSPTALTRKTDASPSAAATETPGHELDRDR